MLLGVVRISQQIKWIRYSYTYPSNITGYWFENPKFGMSMFDSSWPVKLWQHIIYIFRLK